MIAEIKLIIGIIILVVIAALSGGVYYYHSKYVTEVSANVVFKSQNNELASKIAEDSIAVDKLSADSKAREDAAALALANSQKQLQDYTKKAQALLLAAAQTPDNLCSSANYLFDNFIQGK
jgi:hypothetical protein